MKTTEDLFCEAFYPWWRNQTTPHRMTHETANKIMADCRRHLEGNLVPKQMPQDTFDEYMATAHKVVLYSVSWDEAKTKSTDELQKVHQIPKK
jgi:hypothetical protein